MWISNPVTNPYFGPAGAVLAGVLGLGLLVLLLGVRGDLGRLRRSVLFQRWGVWAVLAPLYFLAILGGPLPTLAFLTVLVFQGLREYARLVGLPPAHARILLATGLLATPVAMLSSSAFQALPILLLLGATLLPLVLRGPAGSVRHLAFATLGWGYIAWFLAHLMLLARADVVGQGILLALGTATALSDVGAFVVGSRLGGPKLAPGISPNKTWAGAAGNLLGAYLGTGLLAFALPASWLLAVLPLIVAGGAIWGDLLESRIKREFGAKDAGNWLPGFGGLLDRVDSLILVGPLVFYFLHLTQLI